MAIASFSEYDAHLGNRQQMIPISVAGSTVVAARTYDLWAAMAFGAGAAITTAAAPTRATTGALNLSTGQGIINGGTGRLSALGLNFGSNALGSLMICDRLSHQGGLSGTTTGAQTTNLPTAALTRYTTGEGVMLGITIYSAVGATATTITASYTNQAGTSGQTTPLVVFGGTGFNAANRMVLLPLAAGDTGVRAVASVTITASTTTAGAFGATLFKPLFVANIDSSDQWTSSQANFVSGRTGCGIPEIMDDACLFAIYMGNTTSVRVQGELIVAEV